MQTGIAAGFAALGAVFGMADAAVAKATIYECTFEQSKSRGGGWIPENLILVDDAGKGEILVNDNVIMYFVKKPIPARKSAETKARVTYVWDIDTQNKGQSTKMTYTFSYFSNGQPAKMRAQPGGYDNTWSGDGKCKVGSK